HMASANVANAKAAAKIQFAVSLLGDGMHSVLQRHFGLKNQLDFNDLLKMMSGKVDEAFPGLEPQNRQLLQHLLERAKAIRDRHSRQDFDVHRSEHDLECLLKLVSLMGLSECQQEIANFAGVSIGDWEKLKSEGNEHYKKGRWLEAMTCYTKAIQSNANNAVLYSNRALCEINLRKFDLAREDAEDAIGLDPSQIKFYRILSEALYKLRLHEPALDACQTGLRIDSTDETLLLREQLCTALVMDSQQDVGAEGSSQTQSSDLYKKLRDCQVESTSGISPDEVSPIDSTILQSISELDKAHQILQSGRGDITEEQKAFEIFESVSKQGSAQGLYNMAIMYKDGNAGLARDPAKHFQLCLQAAEQKPYLSAMDDVFLNIGVAEAENALGVAYRNGMAVDKDDKLAFKWFLKSARHGYASAMSNLGLAFYNGTGCERSPTSARWWLQKAADLGQSEAQLKLAGMLIEGEGGPADSEKAVELLKSAADQGLPGALEALQQQMRRGAMKAKRMNSARKIVEEKAAANDKEALFLLGKNYLQGEGGFEQDFELAEMYLRKASDLNHERAFPALGKLLLQLGKEEDAAFFLRKAAESGDAEAQWLFGCMLSLGQGCENNPTEARRWLLRSKKDRQKEVEELLKASSQILLFEAARGLSKDGLSQDERYARYVESFASSHKSKEAFRDIFQYFKQTMGVSLRPAASNHMSTMLTSEQLMAKKAAQGSKTAQKYFIGFDLLDQMRSALDSNNGPEAFRLYRFADRTWQPLVIDIFTWKKLFDAATAAFEKNPKDSEAYFVMIHYHSGRQLSNVSEILRMALACTNMNPNVAEYYNLLGNMYGFNGDGISALRAFERALELHWEPHWLYDKATAIRHHQRLSDRRRVIEAYEEYISANEKDDRHIPEACYCIAFEYLGLKDKAMAREYFRRGLQAESPEVRLPCFQHVNDFPPKKMLQKVFLLYDLENSSPPNSQLPSESSHGDRCSSCGKRDASQRCSRCKKAFYCNRDCQLKHWKVHKKQCVD
ncbi:hypothetical protein BOX15_Mlig005775g2, partial [Macrostomum lignano]